MIQSGQIWLKTRNHWKCYLFCPCTDLASEYLKMTVDTMPVRIHWKLRPTPKPGTRKRPRRLQKDTLETPVEVPLNQQLETWKLAYYSLVVHKHQPTCQRHPWLQSGIRNVLLDSLEDALETPRRWTSKSTARVLKIGILLPGGPQTTISMSKTSLTPVSYVTLVMLR